MPRPLGGALCALALLAFLGCHDEPDDIFCTTSIEPALRVNVRDASTGERIGEGVTVVATDGDFSEELMDFGDLVFTGAYERVGTYDLRVEAEGYVTWTRSGIMVDRNECHVNTVTVDANLEATVP